LINSFLPTFAQAFLVIMAMMTLVWLISLPLRNASIVDIVWGLGFVLAGWFYFTQTDDGFQTRQLLVVALVTIWGLRLSLYLLWRNWGKGEDFRYQEFRQRYGPERYWWFSFFQVFLLQGVLMWLISAPLLGAQYTTQAQSLNWLDGLALLLWTIGFVFEAGGDWQLARFKSDPANKGKLLTTGFWRYTRHPNYFGDTAVWWGFGLFSIAAGSYLPFLSTLLMTALIIKVSGVAMLERSMKNKKPGYKEYVERTSAFIPWPPKNGNR
jgi:steroid 5-alpha reductase family enzyme